MYEKSKIKENMHNAYIMRHNNHQFFLTFFMEKSLSVHPIHNKQF